MRALDRGRTKRSPMSFLQGRVLRVIAGLAALLVMCRPHSCPRHRRWIDDRDRSNPQDSRPLFGTPSRQGHGRNGQRQHYSEKAELARDGQRFHEFRCTLRRSSLPLFASNGFPVLSEIGHRLVALFVVLCLPAIVTILCGFDRVAVGSVVRHPDHIAA